MSGGVGQDNSHLTDDVNTLHYLGPPGTYSHQVALELLPSLKQRSSKKVVLKPCETIKSTLQEANGKTQGTHLTSWSLLPYENNSNGPVIDSYDVLFAMSAISTHIIGEFHLPVNHSLMCTRQVSHLLQQDSDKKEPEFSKLDVVSSHSQALGQCSSFIQSELRPGIEVLATTSTGEAAKQLKDHNDISYTKLHACISSKVCARPDVYDLIILKESIQNSNNNMTRFLLLETSTERLKRGLSLKHDIERAMVRIETSAESKAITTFLQKITLKESDHFSCHVRSIERRARKDAVDQVDASYVNGEGYWPFIYLVEIEARMELHNDELNGYCEFTSSSREAKNPKLDFGADFFADFSQLINHALDSIKSDAESNTTTTCLGIWS